MSEKEKNKYFRKEIMRMIEETDDTHVLCGTYTVISTLLRILAEKGSAA